MVSSNSDSDSYVEEERVFDFGDEEIDSKTPHQTSERFRDYGGEDFSTYLHDDETNLPINQAPKAFPIPRPNPHHDSTYYNATNTSPLPLPPPDENNDDDNFYDVIVDKKSQQQQQQQQQHHVKETSMTYKPKSDKGNKLTKKLKKQFEKATLRFSKHNKSNDLQHLAHNNNNNNTINSIQNFTFADCKMGSSLADQSDSGIGLETATEESETIAGLQRNSWWSVGTLSSNKASKSSPSSTISLQPPTKQTLQVNSANNAGIKGTHTASSSIIGNNTNNNKVSSPASFNTTFRSVFKKVTGTMKKNPLQQHNNNNLQQHNNNQQQHSNQQQNNQQQHNTLYNKNTYKSNIANDKYKKLSVNPATLEVKL